MSGFTTKFGAFLMSFLWNVGVSAAKNGYLSICFLTMSWRIALKRQRRAEPFVSIPGTVISKSSRLIGVRKSLGYCKSLDCVAAVLRGIGKTETGRGKGKRKKRDTFFFISTPFPFTPLPLPLPPPPWHLPRKLPYMLLWNLYIHFCMTVICLQYCKDQDHRTLVDLFYQDDQFMNSGNAFVQDSYNERVLLASNLNAIMLSCYLSVFSDKDEKP